jgi:hypothetical protein
MDDPQVTFSWSSSMYKTNQGVYYRGDWKPVYIERVEKAVFRKLRQGGASHTETWERSHLEKSSWDENHRASLRGSSRRELEG